MATKEDGVHARNQDFIRCEQVRSARATTCGKTRCPKCLPNPKYAPIKAIQFHTSITSKFYGDDYAVKA
jgi:hypothetical protein